MTEDIAVFPIHCTTTDIEKIKQAFPDDISYNEEGVLTLDLTGELGDRIKAYCDTIISRWRHQQIRAEKRKFIKGFR